MKENHAESSDNMLILVESSKNMLTGLFVSEYTLQITEFWTFSREIFIKHWMKIILYA